MTKSKIFITVFIAALLMFYAYLGMGYLGQSREHRLLNDQITELIQALEEMAVPPPDLEEQLAAAQESLAAEQNVFPGEVNSTQVINTILGLADDCEVTAIPLVAQPWSTESMGEYSCRVLRLDVDIEGSFSQLLGFIGELENGEFETLVIEDLSVARVSEQPEGEPSSEGIIPVNASLELALYAQAPAAE